MGNLGIWYPVIRETGEIEIVQAEGVADLISIMGLKDAEHIGRRFRDGSTVHMLADIDGMSADQKINRMAAHILDEPAIFGPAAIVQIGKDDSEIFGFDSITEADTMAKFYAERSGARAWIKKERRRVGRKKMSSE